MGRRERGGDANYYYIYIVTSNHSRKTRRESESVASCGEEEPKDERRGTGRDREGRRRGEVLQRKKRHKSCRRGVENGET